MQDTIFSPAFGNRPSSLVGREATIKSLMDGLATRRGSRERATGLLGQRGSGKTVLLWEIADRAAVTGFVVASPTIVSDGMLERIVEKVQDAGSMFVDQEEAKLSGESVGFMGFSVGLEFTRGVQTAKSPAYKLTLLARKLSRLGHGILILVDELQANSDEVRSLVSVYQELVGEGLDVALLLAGLSGAVSATLNDRVLTFLNRASKITLDALRESDVRAFYRASFEKLGVQMEDDFLDRAASATEGSPYMLQLVGHALVVRAGDDGKLDEAAFEDALRAAECDYKNDVCKTTLAALSERDADFLTAMAADSERSRISDIASRMGVEVDYAQKYRRRLIDAGVIEPAGRGFVRFAVPYLNDYLRQRE